MLSIKDVINFLEAKFPPDLAYEWDNVGLQIGDVTREIKQIMVVLDATTAVIDEAIQKNVELIITHHPFIFSPVKAIDLSTSHGKNIQKLIKNNITVYTMHTNYDIAFGGMNDTLAEAMELQDVQPFAMVDDVHGLGRMGVLKKQHEFLAWADGLKEKLHLTAISYVQSQPSVEKVAVIGGKGEKYLYEAKAMGADVLVTGDVTYHAALDAKEMGLNLLDIGHFSEVIMEEQVAVLLAEQFAHDIKILQPTLSQNPIAFRC
ncbi:MAG: Nif3-like dinuclear metal center hexameric protein [Defluviitaleaceae bacterium]|nr:Nif3-like dinuclear metal center hexameric protein [Defluviitaleaceae bacterium]